MAPVKEAGGMTLAQLYDLSGKVAVVTGGAKGIGQGIADRLAEAGATVLVVDIDAEGAQAAAGAIEQRGGTASSTVADLSTADGANAAVATAVERYGRIDILVNNAGIYPMVPALQLSEEVWDRTLNLNLKGLFFASQSAARVMADAGGGSIINIASVDAIKPIGNLPHYDASKGGVVMLTKSLAKDLGALGIRVNAIAPGAIATPGTQVLPEGAIPDELAAMAERLTAAMPLKRQGEPDDIARTAVFLACPASEYLTGSTIVVDGGMLLI